jgi:hypothetical protein
MVMPKKKLSLLDTIISLPVDPAGMMRHLLVERRVPPYLILCPLATSLVLVAPTLWYRQQQLLHHGLPYLTWSISITALTTVLFFSFFMSVLLKILLLDVSTIKVLAAAIYSLAGLIPFMLAFYLGNFLTQGHLSVLRYLATGRVDGTDWFVRLFPICAEVAIGFAFLLFANALRSVTNSKLISAISLSFLGVPVLIGSFAMSLTIADSIFPETGVEVYRFFTSLVSDPK